MFFFPVFLFVGRSVARSFSARMANARLLVTRVYFRECAFLGRLAARLRDLEGRAQKGVMELGVGRQRKARSRKYAFPKWLGEEQPEYHGLKRRSQQSRRTRLAIFWRAIVVEQHRSGCVVAMLQIGTHICLGARTPLQCDAHHKITTKVT